MNKILAGAKEALLGAQGNMATIAKVKVTPSCGCVFCDLNIRPTKMKRQWIHHIPSEGRIVVCKVFGVRSNTT